MMGFKLKNPRLQTIRTYLSTAICGIEEKLCTFCNKICTDLLGFKKMKKIIIVAPFFEIAKTLFMIRVSVS